MMERLTKTLPEFTGVSHEKMNKEIGAILELSPRTVQKQAI
jgi:hypothetical protein